MHMDFELRKQLNRDMISLIGKQNILNAVSDSISKVNELYERFNNIELSWLMAGEVPLLVGNYQTQGRYIEFAFARDRDINGFLFRQGDEHKNEKDAECYQIPKSLPEQYNVFLKDVCDPHKYGIELKTTSTGTPTGNKAVAGGTEITEQSIKSDRDSFYLFITNIKSGIKTSHLEITDYNVYFGFLKQDDWVGGDKGAWSKVTKESRSSMIRLK